MPPSDIKKAPVQMTRAQYAAKYGAPPSSTTAPVQMTRAEYQAKYGTAPGESTPQKSILQKTTDIVTSIFPGKQVGQAIGTLGGYGITAAKEKLGMAPKGSTDNYDISSPSVAQVLGDVAKGAATVAGAKLPLPGGIVGKAAQVGALGAVAEGGEAAAEGGGLGEVAKGAAIGGARGVATGAAFGVAEKGIRSLGRFLGKTGDKIQTTVIKPSQADIKDGFKIDTVNKYGLGGSLKQTFTKTDVKLDELTKQLSSKIKGTDAAVNLDDIYRKTADRVLSDKAMNFGANQSMESALQNLKGEIASVAGQGGTTPLEQAQTVKRAAGHFGAWLYGAPDADATARQKVYNTFYNEIKTAIEKAAPEGVREINKQISELIPVMNALIRRIPVAERNSAISLTDLISLSAGMVEPRAFSLSLLNLASKSGTVGAALSKSGTTMSQATLPTLGRLIQTGATLSP